MSAASPTFSQSGASLVERLRDATPALLFALRLWVSVCLALYVAFALQLDEPSWAGTTAALICQPVLGASLRKSSYRLIGTVVGAVGIVILAALFRQDRVAFLVGLSLWCAASAFAAMLLRNFASYGAALSGYTAAILAIDVLGPVGTASDSVTLLAIYRALEISIGIVSAGVVLALTDLGHSRQSLAAQLASLTTAIMDGLSDCFLRTGASLEEFQAVRRDLLRRIIALDPAIDSAIGEASDLRYRSRVLQRALTGLFDTISAWRRAAFELALGGAPDAASAAQAVHALLPHERVSPEGAGARPAELRAECCAAARSLTRFDARTPSARLLADAAAAGMIGVARALNGLAGVVEPGEMIPVRGSARLRVADWLPAFVAALRVFATVLAISLFWIASAWPSGVLAVTFCAVIVVLLPVQGDLAYSASMQFLWGCVLSVPIAAALMFGVLPRVTAFPTFCLVLGLALVPLGYFYARLNSPLWLFAASVNMLPMLSPTNEMTFNAANFWNSNLAILFGVAFGAIAMRIIPPLSPAVRTSRLLALTLADLRRLAKGTLSRRREDDWEIRGDARLLAVPQQAKPIERAELVAAVGVGREILRLRRVAPRFVPPRSVEAALGAIAEGRSAEAIERLREIERLIAAAPSEPAGRVKLRLRASVLAVCGQLSEFAPYFDGRAA